MPTPRFITFTGVDESVSHADMKDLVRDYPIEFAILFSPKRQGTPRYPGLDWIEPLKASGLTLAAHLCGDHARDVLRRGKLLRMPDSQLAGFARIQINTNDPMVNPEAVRTWSDQLGGRLGHRIDPILQCRGAFPGANSCLWLYDVSGGNGILPETWPHPEPGTHRIVGYAGGLGPDNVQQILPLLPDDQPFWLDMETSLRSEDGGFDIARCRQICEAVYGMPRHNGL